MKLEHAVLLFSSALLVGLVAVRFARAEPAKDTAASQPADPAPGFIAQMDQGPSDKRPLNWDAVKQLMARKPPAVGDAAPDFTLKTQDGQSEITRSKHVPGKPQVLIFGSFT